jgi:cell division septation protein DedD
MDTQQLSRIGTLHESPVFKYLFLSGNEDQPELIVVLTPHIVRASDAPIPTPVRNIVRPPVQTTVAPAPRKSEAKTAPYTVQVAAFRTDARAGAYAMELNAKYHLEAYVDTLETVDPGYLRYRVRVGHLPNLNAAKELENQLRRDGLDPYVVVEIQGRTTP